MDKNAIKKYAVWARNELIARVTQKAQQYGITADDIVDANADSINGNLLTATEKKQRQALIKKIEAEGFEQVMEEVAYTWFNRFTALRFMEVNNYLPSHVRVFTNDDNEFKPQILAEAINLELDGLDMDKVFELKDANKDEELYKYLLIVQCNALNEILPGMFQKIADYTELLLPDYLLREGSIIAEMIKSIPQDNWTEQVQIIGWLYQYYNQEKKDTVFAALKKNVKITKDNIPAATQLFTPEWIVKYMVENSLGRLWLDGHPDLQLQSNWKYYLEEELQNEFVNKKMESVKKDFSNINPEEIKCIDPCCGSGHILCYMFDVLIQIYEAYGFSAQEASVSILQNNIYGLDIDERAAQLAYFSLMMKAREYGGRRFFAKKIVPHVYSIPESNYISKDMVEYFANNDNELMASANRVIAEMKDSKEYGSIIDIADEPWDLLYNRFEEISGEVSWYYNEINEEFRKIVTVANIMNQKYHVCCTNPPYMGLSSGNSKLNSYVKKNYPDSKTDLFAVFIEKCRKLLIKNGYQAMITQQAWMFISSYEKLREKLACRTLINMVHLGPRAFDEIAGEVVQTTSFIFQNNNFTEYEGKYVRVLDEIGEKAKECAFLSGEHVFIASQSDYCKIPGYPIAYWISSQVLNVYEIGVPLGEISAPRKGNSTSDNNRFLRLWHEVDASHMNLNCRELIKEETRKKRWFPYNKGGGYKKWYGFNDYLIDWYDDAAEIRAIKSAVIANYQYFMKPGLTWSTVSSGNFSIRWFDEGYIFDNGGCCIFDLGSNREYLMALLNSIVFKYIFGSLNPTLNYQSGEVAKFPVIMSDSDKIKNLARECVEITKKEYDSRETSRDFEMHPFMKYNKDTIEECFNLWKTERQTEFDKLVENEYEINKEFIAIYGLENDIKPDVDISSVTLNQADLIKDVKSFISFAVGCMFGRYSLDKAGLICANPFVDQANYIKFEIDMDNIIPICDDEYFSDDIVGLFVDFVAEVFGKESLEKNLDFIATALGKKGTSREIIRAYFINDFYKDHCKMYQKRPMYWLFDSGKKNGFKCLIYMHRYQPDTIARIRTDYVHEQQSRYRTLISDFEQRLNGADTSERVRINKQLKKIQEQADELRLYEEKIHHLADQMIDIDLDDGVKVNYAKFQDVLAKIK